MPKENIFLIFVKPYTRAIIQFGAVLLVITGDLIRYVQR